MYRKFCKYNFLSVHMWPMKFEILYIGVCVQIFFVLYEIWWLAFWVVVFSFYSMMVWFWTVSSNAHVHIVCTFSIYIYKWKVPSYATNTEYLSTTEFGLRLKMWLLPTVSYHDMNYIAMFILFMYLYMYKYIK